MKNRFKAEIAVGTIFIIAMVILGYYTIIMTKSFFAPINSYKITVLFPTIEGLAVTNKVKVNGVEAGHVEDVALVGYRVRVTLRMFKKFTLYKNFSIKIKNEALLGKKVVSIFTGAPLDKGGIEQQIITERNDLPGSFEDPLSSITELVEENRENIHASIRNIRDITYKINAGNGTIAKLLNKDTIHKQTSELVSEIRETIEDAREQAPITSFLRAALTAF